MCQYFGISAMNKVLQLDEKAYRNMLSYIKGDWKSAHCLFAGHIIKITLLYTYYVYRRVIFGNTGNKANRCLSALL